MYLNLNCGLIMPNYVLVWEFLFLFLQKLIIIDFADKIYKVT